MKIVIAGGGIGGLTLGLAAKKAGMVPIIVEKRGEICSQTFGGGIGLWPPSQMVFERLGLLEKLEEVSGKMPKASYFNSKGWKLGEPSEYFSDRYRILCLEREMLSKVLYEECVKQGIEFKTGMTVDEALSNRNYVDVFLSSGEVLRAKALIGADGINSQVRNMIMQERGLPQLKPYHCGYAYFRAVVDLSKNEGLGYDSLDLWHKHSFQSWGEEKRFGYVPLKQPKTFWFMAIPIQGSGLSEYIGSHTCSEQQKKWLQEQVSAWKFPVKIQKLLQYTPCETILRTDIRKIKGVTEFPWNSKHDNILILGDAANATAPNLAQGAGLAIESAWDMVSMIDFATGHGVEEYITRRKKRAETVQNIADLVAKAGQSARPVSDLRDLIMAGGTQMVPWLQKRIFEAFVGYSLGGTSNTRHWLPSINSSEGIQNSLNPNTSFLSTIIGKKQFSRLPEHTQLFRASLHGSGKGSVSIQSVPFSGLLGLPKNMINAPFGAYVDTIIQPKTYAVHQKWTRVFGQGERSAVKYSTIHRATPDYNSKISGLTLTESLSSSFIGNILRFGYNISINDQTVSYKSKGLWLWNYRLPIPSLLLPSSSWVEERTSKGWRFDGTIELPWILGKARLMRYYGVFEAEERKKSAQKRVVIAGGTGLVGAATAKQFYKNGWHVTILSRSGNLSPQLSFAKIVKWNPSGLSSSKQRNVNNLKLLLEQSDAIINLAGQNPGAKRWNEEAKDKILNSRLKSIELITKAIEQAANDKLVYIQASAAGIYGHRGDQILTDDAHAGNGDTFRVNTCKSIQGNTLKSIPKAMVVRIGHVFGQSDGIFPFLKFSSLMRVKKFGQGNQYIPWVHVEDVAASMYHMCNNSKSFAGKLTNIASPDHHTYDSLHKTMGELKNRRTIWSIPQFLIQMMMGEMSSVLMESQRMQPDRLLQNGYTFKYPTLKNALLSRELL